MAAGAVEVVDDEKHRPALEGRRREAARSIEKKDHEREKSSSRASFTFTRSLVTKGVKGHCSLCKSQPSAAHMVRHRDAASRFGIDSTFTEEEEEGLGPAACERDVPWA